MEISFGEKIKASRKAMGLTQKQLADMIGAKHNSISDWEKGKNKPDSNTIEALCRALNMTPNYLLGARAEDAFSPTEKQIIEKYRRLDTYGKELIDIILEKTYASQMARWEAGEAKLTQEVFPAAEVSRFAETAPGAEIPSTSEESLAADLPAALPADEELFVPPMDEPVPPMEVLIPQETSRTLAYYEKLSQAMFDGFTLDALPESSIEIPVTPETEDADFIVRINGDSMEPTFRDGDKVLVQKTDVVGVGDIGVFFVDGECHIKETGAYGLISHNPEYSLIPGTHSIRCVGRVLDKLS